ncbi:HPF/RaiA family ribosome-associated protein [Azohydromonas aeria]|uniref:HPF/RaiA family ribosome-associated protein n=1 Tax=Azohydromonas aeria TaxID=2590212 RepID=UPI0012FA009A|nr:HPF/RaiA family ribosome-associated protein [Azohydromonas aeria]
MEIRVHVPHAHAGDALADHARRRLLYVLMHRQHRVRRIEVRLGDTRSRRGLHDHYCVIQLQFTDAPALTVVDGGEDLYDVIDRAADRAGRLASERLRRSADAGGPAHRFPRAADRPAAFAMP